MARDEATLDSFPYKDTSFLYCLQHAEYGGGCQSRNSFQGLQETHCKMATTFRNCATAHNDCSLQILQLQLQLQVLN